MDYKDYFVPYAAQLDDYLRKFFRRKKKESCKVTPVASGLWKNMEGFVRGGKRIRGGLVKLGYETSGGARPWTILPVAAAIEIIHGAILIHDDIIDQDELRHNRLTVHKTYQSYHTRHYSRGDSLHYGQSMAICVGDAGFYEALSLIVDSSFSTDRKLAAIRQISETMVHTSYGEALDVDLAYRGKPKEEEVDILNTFKTARYTVISPLKIGAILAGADKDTVSQFEKYGLPLGLAFQLQDDILGMFGSREKFGKATDSDIKEGKNTLLYTWAVAHATPSKRRVLERCWGKRDITVGQVREVKKIVKDAGALAYAQDTALKLVKRAKSAIEDITRDKKLQEVYFTLADYMIKRDR